MTFSFDEKDPLERARAERVVKDMLKRGYLLFAKLPDGEFVRVKKFDEKTSEYIVADGPESQPPKEQPPEPEVKEVKRGRGRPRRLPVKGTPVTAVAPTAGG